MHALDALVAMFAGYWLGVYVTLAIGWVLIELVLPPTKLLLRAIVWPFKKLLETRGAQRLADAMLARAHARRQALAQIEQTRAAKRQSVHAARMQHAHALGQRVRAMVVG